MIVKGNIKISYKEGDDTRMDEVQISHLAVVLDVLLHLAAVLPPLDCDVRQDGGDQLDTGGK